MSEITRKSLLAVPARKWDEVIHNAVSVYIIPSARKHDSGYACMDMVASCVGKPDVIRFGGFCDDISLMGDGFRIDCEHPSRIIRIWNCRGNGSFSISHDLSSITFIQDAPLNVSLNQIYKERLK